ncbi:lysophospholipid acyltransferase family protein [Aestuariivita sp.]|jgi:KDO2-lipid IV(A) lauroyltransferase|uniref:lysophospholipid acyltransferase family protein n=1 Tax=Aestuariivita sp. TaxID=1872407 RepID=UPI00216D299D|nr:lysophospholipid acyltransferase family protein [Aestuariivita sp.]MCE8009568.1 lysophospholipid acyltransferase family protein [Aestuariivita sp.]
MPVDASQLSRAARARHFATNLVLRGLIGAVLLLPYAMRVRFMGWLVSTVAAPLAGFDKRIRHNLSLTHPDLPEAEVRRLCRAVPNTAGRTLIEIYSGDGFARHANASEPTGPGLAALKAARDAGRPVFLAGGHFGNYDAMRANLIPRGYEMGSLYRRMANPYFNAHYVRSMQINGPLLFEQGRRGMREMIKHLKAGGTVAILHDLHVHGGEELTFFGQSAVTSLVTAELALKYEAEIIPFYAIRQPNGLDFKIELHAPIPHTDPRTMTQAMNDDLEAMIRQHMDQWFWIHRRWKPWYGRGLPDGGG